MQIFGKSKIPKFLKFLKSKLKKSLLIENKFFNSNYTKLLTYPALPRIIQNNSNNSKIIWPLNSLRIWFLDSLLVIKFRIFATPIDYVKLFVISALPRNFTRAFVLKLELFEIVLQTKNPSQFSLEIIFVRSF